MKFRITAIIALLCLSAGAAYAGPFSTFEVSRRSKGGLVASDKSCDALRTHVTALRAWTERIGETTGPEPSYIPNSNGNCDASLEGSVPRFVTQHLEKAPARDGPNCWNMALVLSGLVPALRYTSVPEMKFWVDSPLCREVRADEGLLPGDIGAIRNAGPSQPDSKITEKHAFIYIAPDLVFAKNGASFEAPYSFHTMSNTESVYEMTGVLDECRRTNGRARFCHNWVNYYRCQTFDEYLQNHAKRIDPEFFDVREQLAATESRLSCYVMAASKRPVDKNWVGQVSTTLDPLEALVKKGMEPSPTARPDNEEMLAWNSLLMKIGALRRQVGFLLHPAN